MPQTPSLRQQRLLDFQKVLSPETGFTTVDSYAKWVFTGTAAVTGLTAFYTKEVAGELDSTGRWAAIVGLALLATALAFSVRALAPGYMEFNAYDVDSMERVVAAQFRARGKWLRWAGTMLGVALLAFGAAPLVGAAGRTLAGPPSAGPTQRALTYSVTRKQGISATFEVHWGAPFREIELNLDRILPRAGTAAPYRVVARTAALTDSAGNAKLQVAADTAAAGTYRVHASFTGLRGGKPVRHVITTGAFEVGPPPAPPARPTPGR